MEKRKTEIIVVTFFVIIQTIIFLVVGMNKEYIHMDEAYSLGLASYERTEIQNNEDFYNQWHTKEYYEDYLSVQDDEIGKYNQVYENQKNDVHPPLYYLILRFAMGFSKGHFSKWPGIIINMILYSFITIGMYFILQKLLKHESYKKEKAIIVAFISSITLASLTNVIYIRMYALSTLTIVVTTWLHSKLLESEKINRKLFIAIGIVALIGSLTHYYFLFYLAILYVLFFIKYSKEKRIKLLIYYTLTMVIAGILSLILFPYSIQHMFFGYRGQGVISNFTNAPKLLINIVAYIFKVNYYSFNNVLFLIWIFIIGILIYQKIKRRKNIKREKENKELLKIIQVPTIGYFIFAAIASPWIELRYIMPICGLLFILVMYDTYQFLKTIGKEKIINRIMGIIFCMMLIQPFILRIEPQVLYHDKKEIKQQLENELNLPTIYFLNSQNNRFLDDILLFSNIHESYIAKDIECNQKKIQNILAEKDISKGVIVFINEGQDNNKILEIVRKATRLKSSNHLKRLNACDVYWIK